MANKTKPTEKTVEAPVAKQAPVPVPQTGKQVFFIFPEVVFNELRKFLGNLPADTVNPYINMINQNVRRMETQPEDDVKTDIKQ